MTFFREQEPKRPARNPLTDVQTYLRDGANYDHGRSISNLLRSRQSAKPKVTSDDVRRLITEHEQKVKEWWLEKAGEIADNMSRAFPMRDLEPGKEVEL